MSANAATYVSVPGGQANADAGLTIGAPGAGGVGGNISMTSALLYVVGGAAALTFLTGYAARKGVKPELGRFDVAQVVFSAMGTAVVFGTVKTIAYHYHGNKLAQAWLLLI